MKELQSFLTKEYVKTKALEETFQLIENHLSLEGQLAELEAKRKKIETEKASIERKIAETQQKIEGLKNTEKMSQVNQISMEIEELRKEVKRNLRHLRKPFIKFRRLVFRKGGLRPEESKKLNHYLENPFEAFATEEAGYPYLKEILRKIDRSMSEGKLKLKRDRERKAEQDINSVLNTGSLDALHQKC